MKAGLLYAIGPIPREDFKWEEKGEEFQKWLLKLYDIDRGVLPDDASVEQVIDDMEEYERLLHQVDIGQVTLDRETGEILIYVRSASASANEGHVTEFKTHMLRSNISRGGRHWNILYAFCTKAGLERYLKTTGWKLVCFE